MSVRNGKGAAGAAPPPRARPGKVIRIDAEVAAALARLARSFEPPNRVIRRLLRLDKNK